MKHGEAQSKLRQRLRSKRLKQYSSSSGFDDPRFATPRAQRRIPKTLIAGFPEEQAESLRKLLHSLGHQVMAVGSPEDVFQESAAAEVDCIISLVDGSVPEAEGFVVNLRKSSTFSTTPIIMVAQDEEVETLMLEAGADICCSRSRLEKELPKQLSYLII